MIQIPIIFIGLAIGMQFIATLIALRITFIRITPTIEWGLVFVGFALRTGAMVDAALNLEKYLAAITPIRMTLTTIASACLMIAMWRIYLLIKRKKLSYEN